jgi:ribose transport system substrate-binding protein
MQSHLKPAALCLVAVLASCGGGRHEPTEKYYLVSVNVKNAYWQTAASGLGQVARHLGVQSEMVGPENYDAKAEAQEFRDAAAKKPAGILVSVADLNVMKDPIDAAIAQGIPVITIDSDAPASKRLTFIGTNNYQAGMMGGRVLAERMHGKGSVSVLTMPGQPNLEERLQGYRTILATHPQIQIAQIVDVKGDPRIAFDSVEQALKSKSVPDAFVCLVSFACPEVADVLDRHKVTGKVVVAMDTDANTLKWIQKGMIAATIAQKPYTMAHFGVIMLDSLYHYKLPKLDMPWAQDTRSPIPTFVDTGATLIDQGNLADFQKAQTAAK